MMCIAIALGSTNGMAFMSLYLDISLIVVCLWWCLDAYNVYYVYAITGIEHRCTTIRVHSLLYSVLCLGVPTYYYAFIKVEGLCAIQHTYHQYLHRVVRVFLLCASTYHHTYKYATPLQCTSI